MKLTDGLFLQCARERARALRPDRVRGADHRRRPMRLVMDPSRFDVLLCENLYGT